MKTNLLIYCYPNSHRQQLNLFKALLNGNLLDPLSFFSLLLQVFFFRKKFMRIFPIKCCFHFTRRTYKRNYDDMKEVCFLHRLSFYAVFMSLYSLTPSLWWFNLDLKKIKLWDFLLSRASSVCCMINLEIATYLCCHVSIKII